MIISLKGVDTVMSHSTPELHGVKNMQYFMEFKNMQQIHINKKEKNSSILQKKPIKPQKEKQRNEQRRIGKQGLKWQ